jgi:hypothetical protein
MFFFFFKNGVPVLVVDLFHIGPDPDPASENDPDPDPDLTLWNGQPAPHLVLPLP